MTRFWIGAGRVFQLAVSEMFWSRRTVIVALVAGGPAVLAVVARLGGAAATLSVTVNGADVRGDAVFDSILRVLVLRVAVPLLGVWYGTALIADEVERKTITYLFIRPIPRGAVIMGRYLAYLACTSAIVLPAVGFAYVAMGLPAEPVGMSFPRHLALLAIGLAAYGAVSALLGATLKQPLVIGLLFAFGWEPLALLVPGSLRRVTIAYYLDSIVGGTLTATSLVWLLSITAVCLLLATQAVERREYILDP